ncbi:MAG: hypothetical protein WBP56_18465 [Polyangia bacterium]
MLADAAGDHIMRSGQHANHGDVDREAPVQIKAVSVRRHSRAPAKTRLVFLPALALAALLALGGVLTSKAAATPTSTAREGKGPAMPVRESFVRPRVILKAKNEIVRIGAPIAVELMLENSSDSEQRLRTGFGQTTATSQPMFEIVFPDGRKFVSYGDQALPSPQFVNYEPIVVGPHQTQMLGRWDIASMTFIERAHQSGNPLGYRPFWELAKPGVYSVRWWDGVFQIWEPLYSNSVRLEVVIAKHSLAAPKP